MTADEAAAKGAFDKPKRLTGGANGGIIESRIYHAGLSGSLQKLKNSLSSFLTPKSNEYPVVSKEYLDSLPKVSHKESLKEIYSSINPTDNQDNCQRCVPAFEMRCRGYDVIATTPLRLGDVLYDDLGYERYQYIFKNAEWLTTAGKGYEDITEYLSKSEKGTRVEVSIKFSSGGHELVAMNDNGIIRFIDVQNHFEIKDFEKYFELVIDGHTRFARIDNLEPTELIKECLEVAL